MYLYASTLYTTFITLRAFYKMGNFPAAVNAYSEAIKISPFLPKLYINRFVDLINHFKTFFVFSVQNVSNHIV